MPTTQGNTHTDTYVFIPLNFELPANAAANLATKEPEEFTAAIKAKRNQDTSFTNKSINNGIGILLNLLQPTTRVSTNNTATCPSMSEVEVSTTSKGG